MAHKHEKELILWFDDIGIEDVALVGGKNASLGEMYQYLTSRGVQVPHGFAITAFAYRHLIETSGVQNAVTEALAGLDTHNLRNLQERGKKVREIIRNAPFPADLCAAIVAAYQKMENEYGTNVDVAVRSSATAEDLPDASFAGQQDTYLNVRGAEAVIDYCSQCFASLFTDRAISYRHEKGFGQFDVYLSIVVQKMVRSDSACVRGPVHHRYRIGIPERGLYHRFVGARRKCRPGGGHPRRILRLQTDPEGRQTPHRFQASWQQGYQDDLRQSPRRQAAGDQYPNDRGRTEFLYPQ